MDWPMVVRFILGVVLLIAGAEALVRGASRLAAAAGISPLVIGLTVVAMGTGSPELAVTMRAAFAGQADIAVGNVVGSNILNVLFVLGASALVAPVVVAPRLLRLDVPVMIVASALLLLLVGDGALSRGDGILFVALMAGYTLLVLWQSRRAGREVGGEYAEALEESGDTVRRPWWIQAALIAGGLVLLVFGADLIVDAAIAFATRLGVSELIISLTVVAVGTSLPEAATSVVAGIRGERDIAVGNVVGSNIFNVLAVLGLAAAVAPAGVAVPAMASRFDIPVMVAAALACLPIFFVGGRVARWEGGLFFAYYLAYTLYLYLRTVRHYALVPFSQAMTLLVIPLTVATVLILVMRTMHANRLSGAGPGER